MSPLISMTLTSSARTVASLSSREREAMYDLMTTHYEAVSPEIFDRDLSAKDEVLMLHDLEGFLCGFTTLAWNPAGNFAEGDILFSGDTIIDRKCWGTQDLVQAFCRRAGQWKATNGRPLFWFLISKGHRTYRYLPLFARRFYPHPENEEMEWARLSGQVAARLFGDNWKPAEGVIRFSSSLGQLREELAAKSRESPWSKYFEQCNPGYANGEELVCLTEMDESNLRRGALAEFRKGFRS